MELGLQEEELSLQKGGKISTSPDGFLEHTFAPGWKKTPCKLAKKVIYHRWIK